jgi:cytosine/adenosine deaminase-related metal-dependent hydrolase
VANIYKDARLDVTVMPPETVLEMATIRGAESLLMEREIGSIERGKRADLVLYDRDTPEWRPLLNPLNNLVYAASGSSVRSVMIDGRLVLDGAAHHRGRAGSLRARGEARAGAGAPRRAHHREQVAYRMKPRRPLRASASRVDSACSRVE